MGNNQEAYNAECAALARALESASRRNWVLERVTILLTHRRLSDEWYQMTPAQGSNMLSRRGST